MAFRPDRVFYSILKTRGEVEFVPAGLLTSRSFFIFFLNKVLGSTQVWVRYFQTGVICIIYKREQV